MAATGENSREEEEKKRYNELIRQMLEVEQFMLMQNMIIATYLVMQK
jgi:hypothetical protein